MNKELIELISNNPDLPIFAWVDTDVVADDGYSRWIGQFGSAEIREYTNVEPFGTNEQTIVFKDDTEDYEQWLIDNDFKDSGLYLSGEEAKAKADNLDYQKAIFVDVDLPDSL